ncbi:MULTISPECIES: oligosaccharide flippase family protein [unclassified Polaromonas]|uniref:oligosaccharide flippase family protein n=1 Tax=unclassified Polaromonas TaxID=2638319 RepID=UPI0025D322FC|nr:MULTISPECIES: oligosaccharide flippase family protein [unclassified Polaromonas]
MSKEKSYAQILRASSIMGGVAGITVVLGMFRVKFAAVLIGTIGVGLNTSFIAIQTLMGTLAGLGLQASAVRDIAAAVSRDDQQEISRKVLTLRRVCWLTGLIGMVMMFLLSPMIGQITFGHQNYVRDIAALGLIILFANLSGGQIAIIQGMRRIGDIARINVFAGILATLAAIIFYATLGLRGIVPALVTASAIQLVLAWYFSRQVPVPKVPLSIKQTFSEANGMVRLGLAMMFSGLMANAVTYATVVLITKQEGMVAVGLFSAAFALSGIFVNFVLGSMAADYYPRLAGVAINKNEMSRLVNEQTEIAILLTLPGLLFILAFAPWLIEMMYSREFLDAIYLLHWFILGCMGRVISWPLSFVMLALGKGRWYLTTETSFNLIHITMIAAGLRYFGLEGVSAAFFLMYLSYIAVVYLVCRYLIEFAWSVEGKRIGIVAFIALGAVFVICRYLPIVPASLVGIGFTFTASIYCLRGLVKRVGAEHGLVHFLLKIPCVRLMIIKS